MKRFYNVSYALLFSICMLIASTITATQVEASPTPAKATVYVYPQAITATSGQNYTVDIRVDDVIDLYDWVIGMTWNPGVLECLSFTEGPFLKAGGETLFVPGEINNTAGETSPPFGCTLIAEYGVNGSGILANVTFRAKASGTFNVHLAEVSLYATPEEERSHPIPTDVADVFTVVKGNTPYHTSNVHNITNLWLRYRVSGYFFNQSAREISFNITAPNTPEDSKGFFEVTIPNTLLYTPEGNWIVMLNGEPLTYTLTENETHSSLYFNYSLRCPVCPVVEEITSKVQIRGTSVFPDLMPPVANAGSDQTVTVGETVSFNASGSTDNVGIVNYTWDFGDENVTTVTGKTITHVYMESGTYTVTLTVKDAAGNSDTDTVTITVEEAPPAFPWWIAAAVAVVVVVVVAAVLVMRRKPSG